MNGRFLAIVGHNSSSGNYQLQIYNNNGALVLNTGVPLVVKQQENVKSFTKCGLFDLISSLQTSTQQHPLSMTWAHDDAALIFTGAGSDDNSIVRVARLHDCVAPLKTLCSYTVGVHSTIHSRNGACLQIWRELRTERGTGAREPFVFELPLARREKEMILQHNYHIIACRVPREAEVIRGMHMELHKKVQLSRVAVCCEPTPWRWYCTIKPVSKRSAANAHSSYVLYMEHMSSMVPILTAKLTNRLVPEFQIQLCNSAKPGTIQNAMNTSNVLFVSARFGRKTPQIGTPQLQRNTDKDTIPSTVIADEDMPPRPFVRAGRVTQSAHDYRSTDAVITSLILCMTILLCRFITRHHVNQCGDVVNVNCAL